MLEHLEALLGTVPFSRRRPGFTGLVIRALAPTETPLVEHHFGTQSRTAPDLVATAREYLQPDCCVEGLAYWDLWVYDAATAGWVEQPQRLEIVCNGEEYDDSVFGEAGHFRVDLGFEHLFTGHAGLLAANGRPTAAPQHPAEAAFLEVMAKSENRRAYQERTCENIHRLLGWMQKIAAALPVERTQLWSEGEENFEARLDEIVAAG